MGEKPGTKLALRFQAEGRPPYDSTGNTRLFDILRHTTANNSHSHAQQSEEGAGHVGNAPSMPCHNHVAAIVEHGARQLRDAQR